ADGCARRRHGVRGPVLGDPGNHARSSRWRVSLSETLRMPEWPTNLRIPSGTLPALLIAIVAAGLLALVPREAPLQQLEVRGEFTHLSVDDVRAAAQPYLEVGFFEVDVGAMREAIAALPWVSSVRVERRWPGAIAIRVSERVPF